METTDFDNFYAEKIEPVIPRLKKSQSNSRAWKAALIASICVAALYFLSVFSNPASSDGWIILLLVVIVVICFYQSVRSNDVYTDEYKSLLINEVIRHVAPGVVFKPDKTVSSKAFVESRLYQFDYSDYEGSDYMEGEIQGVRFQCSELHVSCGDPRGTRLLTVFKGLFVVAALGTHIGGGTFIWPRKEHADAEKLNEYYELLPIKGTQKIISGDAAFDQYFSLRSSAPAEAAFLLTAERRNSMLKICQAMQLPLSFSFVAGRCYVGVPLKDDLLEASREEAGDKGDVQKHYITISLLTGLIRQLQLSELV